MNLRRGKRAVAAGLGELRQHVRLHCVTILSSKAIYIIHIAALEYKWVPCRIYER